MGSTDSHRADGTGELRPLTTADPGAALRLSSSAQWNQNLADWEMMLRLGQGWGIDDSETPDRPAQLAASVVVLPYGERFAWVSMVLVLPTFRRRGHAQRLLRHALAHLAAQDRGALLDATPAGHAVYRQEGFADAQGLARYRRDQGGPLRQRPAAAPTRALEEADWPAIEAMDSAAFGASRLPLLQALVQRWPQAARVVEEGGRIRAFVLGRDGREARHIGPLLAENQAMAKALLHDVLERCDAAVYVDLHDRQRGLLPWLQDQGFGFQRPFTRMMYGLDTIPGDPSHIVLAAGPELG